MANVINLAPEYELNLRTLAAYLRSGRLLARFDMGRYSDARASLETIQEHECGSVGCAVGHASLCLSAKDVDESWQLYSRRMFDLRSGAWQWCFGAYWQHTDNTPAGAASRIEYLLDNGLPLDSVAQIEGLNPLTYTGYQSPACQLAPERQAVSGELLALAK